MLSPVWRIFIELSNSRSVGMGGPNPITYEQMIAYQQVTGERISPLYAMIIKKLDSSYLKEMNNG